MCHPRLGNAGKEKAGDGSLFSWGRLNAQWAHIACGLELALCSGASLEGVALVTNPLCLVLRTC